MTSHGGPRLLRQLGLLDAIFAALGTMIGAGVFVAMGQAAGATGGSLPLAILLSAVVAICNALSAAELGINYPLAGGAYEFGYRVIAPTVGFTAGWIFLLAGVAGGATYTLTFAYYLEPFLYGLPLRVTSVALTAMALIINALGIRISARANNALVIFKIVILLTFVAIGILAFDPHRLTPFFLGGASGLLTAAALLFFAFTGYARPVTIVEELRNPRSDLPRAVAIAVGSTTLLYLAVGTVALGLVGPQALGESRAPLRTALELGRVPFGPDLISVGALVATGNVLLMELWGLSRLVFAMARRGDLPSHLAHIETNGVPLRALIAVGLIVIILTALVDLRPALEASSLGLLIYYGLTNLAALRLEPSARLFHPVVPALGLGGCIVLSLSLPSSTILINLGVIALGLAYYYLVKPRLVA